MVKLNKLPNWLKNSFNNWLHRSGSDHNILMNSVKFLLGGVRSLDHKFDIICFILFGGLKRQVTNSSSGVDFMGQS